MGNLGNPSPKSQDYFPKIRQVMLHQPYTETPYDRALTYRLNTELCTIGTPFDAAVPVQKTFEIPD